MAFETGGDLQAAKSRAYTILASSAVDPVLLGEARAVLAVRQVPGLRPSGPTAGADLGGKPADLCAPLRGPPELLPAATPRRQSLPKSQQTCFAYNGPDGCPDYPSCGRLHVCLRRPGECAGHSGSRCPFFDAVKLDLPTPKRPSGSAPRRSPPRSPWPPRRSPPPSHRRSPPRDPRERAGPPSRATAGTPRDDLRQPYAGYRGFP